MRKKNLLWSEEDVDRYLGTFFCSSCRQECKRVEYDDSFSYSYGDINGVERQSHWASDCCDADVTEGFDCRWCEFVTEKECPFPCPHGL